MPRPATKITREQILDHALDLLRREGGKAVTQPQVARAAGIPQGHLTYYFPKKTDLLLAVARRSAELAFGELHTFLHSTGWPGADAGLRAQALAIVAFMVKNRERTRILIGLLVEADQDPALREVMAQGAARVRSLVARAMMLDDEDDEDVDLVLATLWGLGLQHLMFGEKRPGPPIDRVLARLPDWLSAPRPKRGSKGV